MVSQLTGKNGEISVQNAQISYINITSVKAVGGFLDNPFISVCRFIKKRSVFSYY